MSNKSSKKWNLSVLVVGALLMLIPDGMPVVDELVIAIITAWLSKKTGKTREVEGDEDQR